MDGQREDEPSAHSPELQAWIREVIRRSTRRGRGTDGLSLQEVEDEVRRRLPGGKLDFKRLRGYRADRPPLPVTRAMVEVIADVCGAPAEEGLRQFEHALAARRHAAGPPPEPLPMCGRQAEFAACRGAVEEGLAARRLRTVLVLGGAGFGKTLMADRLQADLRDPPRAELLRIAGAAALDELEARLGGTLWAASVASHIGPGDFAEQLSRRADAVRDALVARAARCATVVVIDDVHHASRPLIDLLVRLADQELAASLAIVALSRPDGRVEELGHARTTTTVELGPLDQAGVAEMVRRRAPGLPQVEREVLAATVADATHGHPAGAAMVIADHLDGRGWRPGSDLPAARASAVQSTLERWARRISALPERTRSVLTAGAVVGAAFDVRLLRPLPLLGDVGDRVVESLEPAVQAGIVRWRGGNTYEFVHELARDAVLGRVAPPLHAEISHQVAAALASVVGGITHPEAAVRTEALFRHRRAALPGYPGEAVAVAEVALDHGRALVAALDDPGAREAFEVGLAALRQLPPRSRPGLEGALLRWLSICPSVGAEGRRRALTEALEALLSAPGADPATLVDITCDYAHLPGFGSRYDPDARTTCVRVLAIVEEAGADPRLLSRLESTIAFHDIWCIQEDASDVVDRARRLAASAWAHAEESGDTNARLSALDARGLLLQLDAGPLPVLETGRQMRRLGVRFAIHEPLGLLRQGDRAGFEGVMEVAESGEGVPWPESWTHQALVLQFHSLRAFLAGDLEAALALAKEMVDRYHDRDPNFGQVFAVSFLWAAYQSVGAEAATAMATAAADEQPGVAGYRAAAALFLARSGDACAALRILDDLLGDGLHAVRRDTSWSVLLAVLAETIALTGAASYARAVHGALLPYAGQVLVLATGAFCYGAADRFIAMLHPLLPAPAPEDAVARFEAAVALERRLEAPALAARTLLWFARTLAAGGDHDDLDWAADLLADAAAECPPQLCELQAWIAEEQAACRSRLRRPLSRRG